MRLASLLFILCSTAFGQIHEDSNNSRVFGALGSSTGATVNTSGTPIKIAGTHTLSGLEKSFDEPVDGRLRYIGEATLSFSFDINFSFTSGTNNINISLFAGKNGTAVSATEIKTRIGTGADVGNLGINYVASLATNDYLEAFLDTSSGNPTITTQHLTMTIESLN